MKRSEIQIGQDYLAASATNWQSTVLGNIPGWSRAHRVLTVATGWLVIGNNYGMRGSTGHEHEGQAVHGGRLPHAGERADGTLVRYLNMDGTPAYNDGRLYVVANRHLRMSWAPAQEMFAERERRRAAMDRARQLERQLKQERLTATRNRLTDLGLDGMSLNYVNSSRDGFQINQGVFEALLKMAEIA